MQNQSKDNKTGRGKRKAEQKDKSGGKENKTPKRPKEENADIDEMAQNIRRLNDQAMALSNNSSTLTLYIPPIAEPLSPQIITEDWTSVQGQFGWAEIDNTTIPYLQRAGEKYVSMLMAENGVLLKFKNVFTNEIYNCFRFEIFRVTPAEAYLLNDINVRHCDNFYGKSQFTVSDTIIALADLLEMYAFLNFCHMKLVEKTGVPQNRCGFIKIAGQNCVPYVWHEQKMYLPLFYFEGDCGHLEQRCIALTGWDLAYLKLYCKIQGIRKNLYDLESSRVVEFEMLKRFFPPDTTFQETWPELCTIEGLLQRPVLKVVLSQAKPKKNGQNAPSTNVRAEATITSNTATSIAAATTSNTAPSIAAASTSNTAPSIAVASTSNTSPSIAVATTSGTAPSIATAPTSNTAPSIAAPTTSNTAPSITATTTSDTAPSTVVVTTSNIAPSAATVFTSTIAPSTAAATTRSSVAAPRTILKEIRPRPKPACLALTQPIPPPPQGNGVGIAGVAPALPILRHQLSGPPTVIHRWRQFQLVGTYPRGSNVLQIPEMGGNNAYYVIKYQIEGRMFHYCINMEPYLTTILLVTLEECGIFMRVPVDVMANAVNVLKIDIFLLNSGQMRELGGFGVYPIRGVMRLTDFVDYLPQLKYMLNGRVN